MGPATVGVSSHGMEAGVNWHAVARAKVHPLQVRILEAAAREGRVSPSSFADGGTSLPDVAYHFRALHKAGLLDADGTVSKAGTVEHFYRLADGARESG